MMWRLLIYSIITLLPSLLLADTLVIAGRTHTLTTPFICEKTEILTPLDTYLPDLGASMSVKGKTITVTAAGGTLTLTKDVTTATIGKQKLTLPVAPRIEKRVTYLPMLALASQLGVSAIFDQKTRTLTLTPLLTVTHEMRKGSLAVLVRSAAPLHFTSGSLDAPPRIYLDFTDVTLDVDQKQIPVAAGGVINLRLSKFFYTPPTVRLVLDFDDERSIVTSTGEHDRLLTILVQPKAKKPATKPAAAVQPSAKLKGIALKLPTAAQAELTLTTEGEAQLTTEYRPKTHQLLMTIPNGLNHLTARQLRSLKNDVVTGVTVQGTTQKAWARVVLDLKKDGKYLVQHDAKTIRVLVGKFSLDGVVIVLDPGHGGSDSGAVGDKGAYEKSVNLDITLRAAKLLRSVGATVILTRDDDTKIIVDDRAALANKKGADLFVAVHCNSADAREANGTETIYGNAQSQPLAIVMQQALVDGLKRKDRSAREDVRGLCVLRSCKMPSVLLEIAFISNKEEEKLLASPQFCQRSAEAILDGLLRYTLSKDWRDRTTR